MDSDFAIVTLPPDLAAVFGTERLLIEALSLAGDAILRGAYRTWSGKRGAYAPGETAYVAPEHVPALEALFTAAMRLKATDDADTIRVADYQHAKRRERGMGPILNSKNPGGYRRALAGRR